MVRLAWDGGGTAELVEIDGEWLRVLSTRAFAPGSRPAGALSSGEHVRMKVTRCRREGGTDEAPRFEIRGRLIDATRALRESLFTALSSDEDQRS